MAAPSLAIASQSLPESRPMTNVIDRILLFALFSGPPKLRLRDPNASLEGVIDWVVLLHLVIWIVAGAWTMKRLGNLRNGVGFRFSKPEKIAILLVLFLAMSAFCADAPGLTAFKVYQLLVTILFSAVFVRTNGYRAAFNAIFYCSVMLCAADLVAAALAPEMVFGQSEFGSLRFRGDLIAQTGVVGVLGLVLLLTRERKSSRVRTTLAMALFGSITIFSLMRTAYLALMGFWLLALWKGPNIGILRRFARAALIAVPIATLAGAFSHLEEYRAAETLWTLSDRVGLWSYLIGMMWAKSPWFGLGYFSASRIYGPEYNYALGNAHSVFVEVFTGGGLLGLSALVAVWGLLFYYSLRLLKQPMTADAFTAVSLLLVTLFFVLIGGELESDPTGFTLWIVASTLPFLWQYQAGPDARLRRTQQASLLPHASV
ncbi:MAG: hypothetical protein JO159_08575 [Acidobacteria bacterium]|nr:hypothetical protein [Acidobacteriota bacterium]